MPATFANQGDLVEDKPLFANQGEVVEEPQFEPPHTPEFRRISLGRSPVPVGEETPITPAMQQAVNIWLQKHDPRWNVEQPSPSIGRLIGQGMEWVNRTFPAPPEPMPAPLTPIVAPPTVEESPEVVARRELKQRVYEAQRPISTGIGRTAEKLAVTMAQPSGPLALAATPLAPQVMLPIWSVLGTEGSLDALERIQRARETGDRTAYYEAVADLGVNAPMALAPMLPRSRAAAGESTLTLSPNIVPLPAEPIQPLQPFLGARVQPGARAGFPTIEPRQEPEVPGTALEARETVIEAIRKADARTLAQIQALFPEARLSREQARVFRNIAFPPVPEPVRPQATVQDILGQKPPEPPPEPGGAPVPKQPITPAGGPENAIINPQAAKVYESLPAQPGKGQETLPAEEGGIRVPAPETAQPEVPLTLLDKPPEYFTPPNLRKLPVATLRSIANVLGTEATVPAVARKAKQRFEEKAKEREEMAARPKPAEEPKPPAEPPLTPEEQAAAQRQLEEEQRLSESSGATPLVAEVGAIGGPVELRGTTVEPLATSGASSVEKPLAGQQTPLATKGAVVSPSDEIVLAAGLADAKSSLPSLAKGVGIRESQLSGGGIKNPIRLPKKLADLFVRFPIFDKNTQSFNVEAVRTMLPSMIDILQDPKVFKSVIKSIPVDVVNMLASEKFPSERLLHDNTMFKEALSLDVNLPVARRLAAFFSGLHDPSIILPAKQGQVNVEKAAPATPAPVAEAKAQDKARTVADYWKSKSGAYRETSAGLSAGGATGKAIGGTFKEINERKAAQKSRRMEALAGKTELTPQEQTEIANTYKNLPKEVRTPPETKPGPVAPETPAVPPQGPPEPPREFGMAAGGGFGGRRFGLDMANLWQDIKALWQRRPIKRDMAQLADAMIDTIPANKGREAGNELRVLTKERTGGKLVDNALARKAVVFVIQAKGDRAKLAADLSKVAGNKEAEASINYAQANWDALQPLANRTKSLLDAQIVYERANGIDTEYENHYVPQRHENIVTDRGVLFGETSGGPGSTGFKKAKVFPDYASAIEAGYIPRNLDIADLVEHRVRTGQRLVNRKLWADGLRTITDPFSGEPIVTDMIQRRIPRPDGTTDTQYTAPQGYVVKEIIPGVRIAVRQGYSHLFNALTGTSQIRESAVGRGALSASGWLKHQLLLLDSFHASRTMQTSLAARGKTTYEKGLSLLELSDRAITDAVNHNLITSEMASWIRTPQPFEIGGKTVHMTPREVAQLGQRNGLNVGRFADALYNDAKGLVGTNRFSRWLFEKLTRGAMVETFLDEFGRVANSNPTMDSTAVARKVARDINVMFGNLQRQSVIKNPAIRDLMQIAFLAPQWVESLARRELRAVGQTAEAGFGVATGKGLHVGTVAKTVGTGLAAYVALTQLLNYIFRGHGTMQNEEEGHKLDAYIPDPTGQSDGFWFSPLSVFGEITHDFLRYSHTEPTAADIPQRIAENKLGPVGRSLKVMATGEDPFGTKLPTTWDRAKEAGLQLIPLPIGVQPVMQAAGKELGVEGMREPRPGALVRQASGSLGFKIEPYREGEAQMKRAREINTYIDYWIRQARQISPEHRQEYLFNQMREVGLSPQEIRKVKREIGESGVLKYR